MTLGPFLFMAPLALAALVALPVIWWVLRATPPQPVEADLPSLRLLDDVDPREEMPARTPWWVLLLRVLAAALAILGLSQPIYAPGAQGGEAPSGPLLIIVDDGWQAATRWNDIRNAAEAALDTAERDTAIHILQTAARLAPADPAERLSRQDASARLASLDPLPWSHDRASALERLDASGLRPGQIVWASDGLETDGDGAGFADALAAMAPLTVFAAPPRGAAALTALRSEADGATLTLRRATPEGELSVFVSALTVDGSALATAEGQFGQGQLETPATFSLPGAALSRVNRFALTGEASAGAVWLWDATDRSRRVGIVSAGLEAQPLLSDVYYVRKALEPYADLIEGTLEELILAGPDAIVLTDVGRLQPVDMEALTAWLETGGALIRFAGPRLAAQGDALLPTPIRRTARALGGALAWDEPQALGPFAETSPFSGLGVPDDVLVRQQVLAQPVPDLQARTWARLADGSPIVTADRMGAGTIILFHVTAGPDWSDLPYDGVFAQMLRRAIAAGRGETRPDGEGLYSPQLTLTGFGRLESPPNTAAPLRATEFEETAPSETHPPGFYRGPAGARALNTADGRRPLEIADWPTGARLLGDAEATSLPLAGPLLGGALALLALDLMIALLLAGKFRAARRTGAALVVGALALGPLASPPEATAQISPAEEPAQDFDKATEAALVMRFGYVLTGDGAVDEATRAGLEGLARLLNMRTSVEPAAPHALDLETDALDVYPLIFLALPDNPEPFAQAAIARLSAYVRNGGALVIDTRRGGGLREAGTSGDLSLLLEGLDAPPLAPAPDDHVLTRSFYLIDSFPGRYDTARLWIEAPGPDGRVRGDGISRLFIGDADWAAAWAADDRGRPLYSVDGGDRQRELAYRFGVNLTMYVLTGNYKADQVHIPALLERLGQGDDSAPPDATEAPVLQPLRPDFRPEDLRPQ